MSLFQFFDEVLTALWAIRSMSFMKNFVAFILLVLVFSFIPMPVFAERPFQVTETAIPTERGTYRLETGLLLDRGSSNRKKSQVGVNLRYGLIQNLEFDLEVPYIFAEANGEKKNKQGDVLLKTKIRFIKGRAANPLSIAGQMVIKFPTAGENTILRTSGVVDVGFVAIASKTFSPVTAHINFGYFFIGNPAGGQERADQLRYALALELVLDEASPMKLIGELYGRTDTGSASKADDVVVLAGGFSLKANHALSLDTTVGYGLNSKSPDYLINLGLSYAFD